MKYRYGMYHVDILPWIWTFREINIMILIGRPHSDSGATLQQVCGLASTYFNIFCRAENETLSKNSTHG